MEGMDRLGPWPEKAVAAFRDLGLTEQEIARYFRVDARIVRHVERTLNERRQRGFQAQEARRTKTDATQTRHGLVR